MTRRERLEAKLTKREEWAAGRKAKAAGLLARNEPFREDIAFNTQPGHIPERARVIRREEKAVEHLDMAAHHAGKAFGLSEQLERSVFSDDTDAIEQLEARIAEREADAKRSAAINKAWRKCKGDIPALVATGLVGPELAQTIARTVAVCPWLRQPFDTALTRASIRRDRERIEEIKRRCARTAAAEAGGGVLIEGDEWVRVTFAEKPPREILEALRAAGFFWGGGHWSGKRSALPAAVLAVAGAAPAAEQSGPAAKASVVSDPGPGDQKPVAE